MAGLPLRPGDTGPMVTQMQTALIGKGYSVGSTGANGTFAARHDRCLGIVFSRTQHFQLNRSATSSAGRHLRLPGP